MTLWRRKDTDFFAGGSASARSAFQAQRLRQATELASVARMARAVVGAVTALPYPNRDSGGEPGRIAQRVREEIPQ
ncbi:hypothetical protein EV679_2882 [Kerstersia gyiorum]|uniref:Uncharacterized protein n=1 Tax=Kerstersia gyiorum TaxID=206506 RepID=A0A4Q7MEQ7_9BURK|nr:hypothetical protein EV679_2882 [Kerstersia gyiorum]